MIVREGEGLELRFNEAERELVIALLEECDAFPDAVTGSRRDAVLVNFAVFERTELTEGEVLFRVVTVIGESVDEILRVVVGVIKFDIVLLQLADVEREDVTVLD